MRILAVGGHPDDIELLCAGTLLKFRKRGDEIFTAVLCNGDKGHYEIGPEELARIRRSKAAAKSEKATLVSFGAFPDLEVYNDSEGRRKVAEIIRQVRPDLVITHYPDNYMCDHSNTGRLVIDASFIASIPNYRTESPHTGRSVFFYGKAL